MLQNSRVSAFTVLELLRENQMGGGVILPSQIRVKADTHASFSEFAYVYTIIYSLHRSSHLRCSVRKGVLKARIHCEIFLSDYFTKHSLMYISLHLIWFHEIHIKCVKRKPSTIKGVITWSRFAGMKFCPALPGSRQYSKLFINFILWLHGKSFILARRDPAFVLPGRNFPM